MTGARVEHGRVRDYGARGLGAKEKRAAQSLHCAA
jgi:hypothetical protein